MTVLLWKWKVWVFKCGTFNSCENFAVVRGISDLIENKESTDKDGYQDIAAIHAAEFTFNLISKVWKNIKPRHPKAIGVKLSFKEILEPQQIDEIIAAIKKIDSR
ncbi:MAG: hypothetical protein IPM91_16050 [Bacteroidetes bacterium]|nr:hypothetical protein [Bacteroidota bacterium]